MKVRFRPLKVADFYDIQVQERHKWVLPIMRANPLALYRLAENPFAFTMAVDGKPLAACGVTPQHEIWALLGPDMKSVMLRLFRYGKAMMDAYGQPLWAHIDRSNPAAVRLALTAGMRKVKIVDEGTMDVWTYARP